MDDARAIEALLYRYADLIDAGDFAGIGRLFERGRIVASSVNARFTGAKEVQGMYEGTTRRYPCGTPRTQHVMSNVSVRVGGDGKSAEAGLRFTVFQALEDFPLQAIITGRYEDRFAKDESGWYFVERRIFPELIGDLSRHLLIKIPAK